MEDYIKKIAIQTNPVLLDMIPNSLLKIDFPNIFNPSIVLENNNITIIARQSSHPIVLEKVYKKVLKSNLQDTNHIFRYEKNRFNYMGPLDDEVLKDKYKFDYHGVHDIRLIKKNDEIYGLGVMLLSSLPQSQMRQVLFRIDKNKIVEPITLDSPFGLRVEKNWMPVVVDENFFFVYSLDPFVLLEYSNEKFIIHGNIKEPPALKLYGNTQFIKYKNIYLGLAHHPRILIDKYYYLHCFVVLNENLEFIEESPPFFLMRRGVEFATGLSLQGENLYITFGVADKVACMAKLQIEDLKKLVHSIY